MHCDKRILKLVKLPSKTFGAISEKIIKKIFKITKGTNCQHDGIKYGKKIEIKTARYWSSKDDCRWQHIELEYDYDIVIFALLDFHGWKFWCIKKVLMGKLRKKKIITNQGKQGLWTEKSKIISFLTPINSISDFDNFIQ